MSNQRQLSKLSILPVNKTVVFYSPIEGRDILVRTGTIGEGSCFFHSVLHAQSKDYVRLDRKGRMKLVAKLRESFAEKLDRKRWENMSNGLVAKIPFQENISKIMVDFYRCVKDGKVGKSRLGRKVIREVLPDDKAKQNFGVICELITLDNFEKNILPDTYEKCADDNIEKTITSVVKNTEDFCDNVFSKFGDQLDEPRRKFCKEQIINFLKITCHEAEKHAFSSYVEDLKDSSVSVDTYTIGLLSDKFNRDIYFLDSGTRMPYQIGGTDNVKDRKSIIIMWTGGNHYEVVGRLLPKDKIQREFYDDDPLICRIRTFLFKPERVHEQYPALVPYLPKNHRENIGFSSRESSSDENSESEEESEIEQSEHESVSEPEKEQLRESHHEKHREKEPEEPKESRHEKHKKKEQEPKRRSQRMKKYRRSRRENRKRRSKH